MLLYINGLSKNPLKSPKTTVQKQEGCKPCGCSWDAIKGLAFLLASWLFLHHPCRVKSHFHKKRCATTRPKAPTSLARLPLGREVLPNHASGGVFQRTFELTHALHPSSRSAAALFEDKFWGCFPRKKQMLVILKEHFTDACSIYSQRAQTHPPPPKQDCACNACCTGTLILHPE